MIISDSLQGAITLVRKIIMLKFPVKINKNSIHACKIELGTWDLRLYSVVSKKLLPFT